MTTDTYSPHSEKSSPRVLCDANRVLATEAAYQRGVMDGLLWAKNLAHRSGGLRQVRILDRAIAALRAEMAGERDTDDDRPWLRRGYLEGRP